MLRARLSEALVASTAYFVAYLVTFQILMPLQNAFFPAYPSQASLLFLPHGVRVLSAWLLGWRAIPALLPGVFLVFLHAGGLNVFMPSRLAAIAIAVTVVPVVFYALKAAGWDLFPRADKDPCWTCIMGVGVVTSLLISGLTNMVFGSATAEYIAFLIGDVAGLFFLMLGLLYFFRFFGNRSPKA
ncbi:hypothetical protein M3P21_13165 [Ruegeria sp. 2012CJ41-6]|uniref:QueT transporter family protein n=1 Tax=Ruegeria spongiae TaxID=2942209 RepID=A0ABT0Q3S4_9RHOB|nr:hypothetical protein [Ruegeria spongiae]MCL6284478.1 hypothetical protein [Ruegeria spongiae]